MTIATDFTRGAALAAGRAALLPLASRARIALVHVLPPDLPAALRSRERTEARTLLEREASQLRRLLRKRGRNEVRVAPALASGEPYAELLRRARKDDLLILGRHGTRRFRDLLIGSTAERVIRAGHVPVLIVAAPARRPYRRPLLAVDLSPASRAAAAAVKSLLPSDARVEVVHVYETAHDALLRRVAGERGVTRYLEQCREAAADAVDALLSPVLDPERLLLRRGDARGTILAAVRALDADLIAVGSHGRPPLAGALVGSVAEAVTRHAPCDALVVHPA
ncbi:MAG TPA: universal stress protein [Gemmatimonadales bacterium]